MHLFSSHEIVNFTFSDIFESRNYQIVTRDLDEKAVIMPFAGPPDESEEEDPENGEQYAYDPSIHLDDHPLLNDESWE